MNPAQLVRTITSTADLGLPRQPVTPGGMWGKLREKHVDYMSRFYDAVPEVEDARQRMTLALNKAGASVPEVSPLAKIMREIHDNNLGDPLKRILETDQAQHVYATQERHHQELMDDYYAKLGTGDAAGARESRLAADELRGRIDRGEISPIKLGDIDQIRNDIYAEITPEHEQRILRARQEVLRLGERIPDLLEGIASPEAIQRWRDNAHAAPYINAARQTGDVVATDGVNEFLKEAHKPLLTNMQQRRGVSASSLDNIIKRMEESDQTLFADPVEAQTKIFQKAHIERARQGAAREALSILREAGHSVREVDSPEKVGKLEGVVSYLEDGKVKHYAIDGELADIVNMGGGQFVSDALAVLGKFQRLQSRMITTWNLGFALRNVPKDIGDTLSYVKEISTPADVLRFLNMWKEVIKQEYYEGMSAQKADFYNRGGGLSNLQAQISDSPLGNQLTTQRSGWAARKFESLENLQSSLEVAPKVATYRFLTEIKGMDPDKAAYIARTLAGSPDFGRKGTMASQMMGLIQFWNPQVQGIAKLAEFKDPARLGGMLMKLTAGYLALDAYNSQFTDPDGKPEIERVPWTERRNNLIFMVPDFLSGYEQKGETTSKGRTQRSYLKLPLGHGIKFLLSPIIDGVSAAKGEEFAPDMGTFAANTAGGFLPTNANIDPKKPWESIGLALAAGANPLIRYPVEEMMNKYAYLDIPIEGARVQGLDPQYRYTGATSELAKLISKGVSNAGLESFTPLSSPERADHLLRTLMPGVAELPVSVAEGVLQHFKEPGPQRTRQEQIAKLPIMGPMIRSLLPSGGDERRTAYSKNFYDALQSTAGAVKTMNKLAAEGNLPEAVAFAQANKERIEANRILQAFSRELSNWNKAEQQVINSNLTPDQKTRAMKLIYDSKLNILARVQPIAKTVK